jgi:DNA-binding NtrC family response regulator
MENSKLNIIIIDDNLKETEPFVVELKLTFKEAKIKLINNAKDGLDYVLNNLTKKMIVLLDYDLGANEPNGTEIFIKIRKKTSLLYMIIITAKLIDNIPVRELATYINKDALAIIDKTASLKDKIEIVQNAAHSIDVRVDSILEQWVLKHSKYEPNEPYLTTVSGQTYTLKEILTEIRQGTDLGKSLERKILLLAIDLLTRGKKQIDD